MNLGYIYALAEPNTDNVRYIGQTIGKLSNRYKKHICDAKQTKTHLQCWITGLLNKGIKPDIFIVDEVPIPSLDINEVMYIGLFKTWGFNLTNIALGGQVNRNHSLETRAKISASLKGNKQSIQSRIKRSISLKETWASPELRELKRRQTTDLIKRGILSKKGRPSKLKGTILPYEQRQLLKQSLTSYWADQNRRDAESLAKGGKPINVYEVANIIRGNRFKIGNVTKGKLLFTHHNKSEIARRLGAMEKSHIRRCLKGELKQSKGYIFEYAHN